ACLKRLLIVIHHLAVDGVSWRILLEDLHTACFQQLLGEALQLPAKSTSFQQWSLRLYQHVAAVALDQQRVYGLNLVATRALSLPVDHELGPNTMGSSDQVSLSLSTSYTRALLHDTGRAYHTEINDLLLAALTRTLSQWTQNDHVWIELEGHGRE